MSLPAGIALPSGKVDTSCTDGTHPAQLSRSCAWSSIASRIRAGQSASARRAEASWTNDWPPASRNAIVALVLTSIVKCENKRAHERVRHLSGLIRIKDAELFMESAGSPAKKPMGQDRLVQFVPSRLELGDHNLELLQELAPFNKPIPPSIQREGYQDARDDNHHLSERPPPHHPSG